MTHSLTLGAIFASGIFAVGALPQSARDVMRADVEADGLVLLQIKGSEGPTNEGDQSSSDSLSDAMRDDGETSVPTVYYKVNCPTSSGTTEEKWFSGNMVMLGKNVLWCPNAKVGTTTVYRALQEIPGWMGEGTNTIRCYPSLNESHTAKCWYFDSEQQPLMRSVTEMMARGQEQELCDAFTFTFVRNPWDRLRSAYLEKIASGKRTLGDDQEDISLADFVHFVYEQDANSMNMHWRPISTTCLTAGTPQTHYDKIYRLEDGLNEQLAEAMAWSNLDYPNVTEAYMSRPPSLSERIGNYTQLEGLQSSDELVKLVAEKFAEDVAVGNYKFDEYK